MEPEDVARASYILGRESLEGKESLIGAGRPWTDTRLAQLMHLEPPVTARAVARVLAGEARSPALCHQYVVLSRTG